MGLGCIFGVSGVSKLSEISRVLGDRILLFFEDICRSEGVVGLIIYGSLIRGDYVEGISDVNIAVIGSDVIDRKRLWNILLFDSRISPIFLRRDKLVSICMEGDLLCHSLFKESIIYCGSRNLRKIPEVYGPRVTPHTVEQAKSLALDTLGLAVEGYLQRDRVKLVRNAYHSLRYTITYYTAKSLSTVPLRDKDVVDLCIRIAPSNLCRFFSDVRAMRISKQELRLAEVETLLHLVTTSLKITLPPISSLMLALKNLGGAKPIALKIKIIDRKPYGLRAHYFLVANIPSKNRVVEAEVSWNGMNVLRED